MATFGQATGHTITDAFKLFDKENPHVYELFKVQVFRAINADKKKISSKQILGFIRWEIFIKTKGDLTTMIEGKEKTFKINDAYTSRYARKFISEYPQYNNIFDMRNLRTL